MMTAIKCWLLGHDWRRRARRDYAERYCARCKKRKVRDSDGLSR